VTAYSEAVDIMPTILDWLEIDIPRQCDGASLIPFCEGGEPDGWRQEIHWEYDFRNVADSRVEKELGITMDQCVLNVIRDEEYKYVHFAALPPLFFDRKNDPLEQRNLADDPAYAPQMLKYAAKLLSWRMENDERTLTGMKLTSDGIIERS
jgi:arylsulfatase A-like enzyme